MMSVCLSIDIIPKTIFCVVFGDFARASSSGATCFKFTFTNSSPGELIFFCAYASSVA